MSNKSKLKALSRGAESKWRANAEARMASEAWVDRSTRIALNVLEILRQKGMSKQELAERMHVSAQYISKIVKGRENLTLETIWKLESALEVKMLDVKDFSPKVQIKKWSCLSQTGIIQRRSEQDSKYKSTSHNYSYAS